MDGADTWDLYRSFLGVLRFGSLSAAARELALTQPTLGRHIDALEAALGTKLFARSRHGLAPTQAALTLLPHAEAMEAAALALRRAASGEAGEPAGAVRVTASNVIGAEVLPQILTQFRERHPAIAIELALSDRTQDLSRRDADIAVRMVRPTQKALIAKRLGAVRIGLFAHTRYLARRGTPRNIDELAHHDIIGFDRETAAMRSLGMSLSITRDLFALRTDDNSAQLNALRAGFGLGICQMGIAARDKNLVAVLPGLVSFQLEMWLVMHQDLRANKRVRLLFDHLAAALKDYAAIRA
ncbi:MAG TPA: LysR substrate-binding domain-containing protein [Rhizomicrobium sp.]|nr:LysR substrate-binding domain-containing protein [Rhizomicrobium sp.]